MAGKDRISVRALAEFALERGDLARASGALDRMLEGAEGHRLLQGAYADGFKSEVGISLTEEVDGRALTLYGRIDGLNERTDPPVVEELSNHAAGPGAIGEGDFPRPLGQVELTPICWHAKRGYGHRARATHVSEHLRTIRPA
jgi:hypothetical protein